ncbi:hypothetical protein QBC43DRAFT_294208 [Cladorrhinum sp. PSN259]|nr:hypothetical protein QBC43DRAFT_294208 [Cladorrhinum sp. PSN259]
MVSSTNPDNLQSNCVIITLARLHNCETVEEFWSFPPLRGVPLGNDDDGPYCDQAAIDLLKHRLGDLWGLSAYEKMVSRFEADSHWVVGREKTNFYTGFWTIDNPFYGHAVLGTVVNRSPALGPEGPFEFSFSDYQHSERDSVDSDVMTAVSITVIMLLLPSDPEKRAQIERELDQRNHWGVPRVGAWNDRYLCYAAPM